MQPRAVADLPSDEAAALALLRRGFTENEVARELGLQPAEVRQMLDDLARRWGLPNRYALHEVPLEPLASRPSRGLRALLTFAATGLVAAVASAAVFRRFDLTWQVLFGFAGGWVAICFAALVPTDLLILGSPADWYRRAMLEKAAEVSPRERRGAAYVAAGAAALDAILALALLLIELAF